MIKELKTREELDGLGSALTIEGLLEDSIPDFIDWVKEYTDMVREDSYIIKGRTMNRVYGLTEDNAYDDDLTIVSIKLEDMENPAAITFKRFDIGARWFDDIVWNNEMREQDKQEYLYDDYD